MSGDNILIVSYLDYPFYAGLSRRISGLARVLTMNGLQVRILAPIVRGNSLPQNDDALQYVVEYVDLRRFRSKNPHRFTSKSLHWLLFTLVSFFRIVRGFVKCHYRLIQYQSVLSAIPVLVAKLFLRAHIIGDDIVLTHSTMDGPILRLTDIITTPSIVTYVFSKKMFPHKIVLYVPNGIELPQLKNSMVVKNRAVFVGALTFDQNLKAIEKIFYVAKKLYEKNEKIEVLIVGGPLSKVLDLRKHQLVKNETIKFLGYLPQKRLEEIYASASIGLLPFFKDTPLVGGQRIKALDYFTHNLLVVSGPEGVRGIAGLRPKKHYLPAKSLNEMVSNLEKYLSDPAEYAQIASEGKKYVLENFSWQNVSRDYVNLVRAL